MDANGNNITLDEPTLSRVHLTYNTDSKDWFTYGKMDARTKLALDAESYAKDSDEFASVVAEIGTEAFVRYEGNKDFTGGSKIAWNGLSKVDWEHYGYDVTDKSFHLDGALTFYSVRFNANAGEDNVSNMPVDGMYYDGEQLLVVASPMRPGYRFTGWYKDAACTERYTFTENGITENLTLYAGWEEAKAANPNVPVYAYFRPVNSKGETITLDDAALARTGLVYNSNTKDWFTYGKTEVFASLTDASYGADSAECKNAADALAGESFMRHEDNKDFAGAEKIDWFELKQVEAPHLSFAKETGTAYHLDGEITFFSVTFNANAGEDTVWNLPESGMYYDGERLPASIAPSRDGYVFGGWYDDAECTIAHTFTTDEVTEDITVYAKWTVSDPAVITYKLTINYVYANGTEAAESKVLELVPGAEYNETSPYISGYRADKAVVKGTMPDHALTETVTYTRRRTSSGSTSVVNNPLKFNTAEHFAYVNGYPDGTVRPEGNITRAEVAAILYRIMDEACADKYKTTSSSYKDVARGDWFNTYVATLENAGVIVDTKTGGNFRPNEAITRAELATMLAQFATTTTGASNFKDVASSHWASREIAIAAKMGWINGYPDGSFRPDQTITRAEMMAMVNRALERTPESEDDLLSGMKTWSDNARTSAWYYLDVQEATNGHTYTKSGPHETWKKLAN